jgi:hypothetical protein
MGIGMVLPTLVKRAGDSKWANRRIHDSGQKRDNFLPIGSGIP